MFCPKCESEYRPGFHKCVDCDLPLVDSLPVKIPRVDKELMMAFDVTKDSDLYYVTSTLDSAEIPYVIENERSTVISGGALVHVLIPQDRYEDAVTLLESRAPTEESKLRDTGALPLANSLSQGNGTFDLHKFARFILIGGLLVIGFGILEYIANLPVGISGDNFIRASNRDEAAIWLVGGAIVAFLGFAVSASITGNANRQSTYRGQDGGLSQNEGDEKSGT